MRRNYDLIRLILKDVEAIDAMTPIGGFTHEGYDDATIAEHVDLLVEAGLLKGGVTRTMGGPARIFVHRLTWAGHDFLEAMKDDGIWAKARESILKPAGGVAFDVLLDWLKWKMKEKLGLPGP